MSLSSIQLQEQSGYLEATEYRIELRETGANVSVLSKRAAGQHLDLAALHVKYLTGADNDGSCLAAALAPEHCEAHGQQSTVLTLYSGCPPGRTLHFDAVASYKDAMGRVLDHGCNQPAPVPSYDHFAYVGQAPLDPETAPCVWVGHDFYPSFSMYDSVTGRSVPYSGTFRLTIVAGGPTHDTIQPCLQTSLCVAVHLCGLNASAVLENRLQIWHRFCLDMQVHGRAAACLLNVAGRVKCR